jgi:glycosyltransferase involved in cell wall biosynthesis
LGLFAALKDGSVIHCHQQHVLASSVAAAYARVTGRRVFVTDLGGGGWDISGYWSTDSWFHGHLHISEYSRRVFGQEAFARARVILGGVDQTKFSPDAAIPKESLVLFVGRVLPHKGINYLIEGLPDGLRLEVVGHQTDARYFADLQRLASGKSVTFIPNADDAVLIGAYRRAMCVVLPSVYRTMYGDETRVPELLGQTLLEGMACGLPAICTDVASMPEVVTNGITGFVVPPNNPGALREKLVWLRDHPDKGHAMGVVARERVLKEFTWAAVVQRCLEAYRA